MPGLQKRDRYDSYSDVDDPRETKTKNNPMSINRGAAGKSNQNNQNKSMNNNNNNDDDDDDNDIVIIEDVNKEEEENDEPVNHGYSKRGIFETNNSINKVQRDLPNNINNDGEEVKLPNVIKTLSSRKFKGDEFNTYGDELQSTAIGMLRISGFNTNSIKLDEVNQHVKT